MVQSAKHIFVCQVKTFTSQVFEKVMMADRNLVAICIIRTCDVNVLVHITIKKH